MIDPLLARAELAVEQGRLLRAMRKSLLRSFDDSRARLRRSVLKSETVRSELRATRAGADTTRHE